MNDNIRIIPIAHEGKYRSARLVFDPDGIAPCLSAAMGEGGGFIPMIIETDEPWKQTSQEKKTTTKSSEMNFIMEKEPTIIDTTNMGFEHGGIREYNDTCPTIRASREGLMVTEPVIAAMRGRDKDNPNDRGKSTANYRQRLEVGSGDTSNTLTSVSKDNLVVEPQVLGWTRDGHGNVVDLHPVDVANCVTAAKRDNTQNYVTEQSVRIRRLTERELFRLMDVDDTDIDTLLGCGVSKTQLAKMAGNSIVVNVLYHIFRTLFVDTEPQENQQLQLF